MHVFGINVYQCYFSLQVSELYWALRDAQRDDLAEELLDRNAEYQQEAQQKVEGMKVKSLN